MVTYQFEIDDETWQDWKLTVPRDKSLEKRIVELIEADADGRVLEEGEGKEDIAVSDSSEPDEPAERSASQTETPHPSRTENPPAATSRHDKTGESLPADLGFPGGVDRDEAAAAIYSARDYIREQGGATMREIVLAVSQQHPLKYGTVDELEEGERYRGSWWRKVVKPGLEALPDVEKPAPGQSDWTYTGGGE